MIITVKGKTLEIIYDVKPLQLFVHNYKKLLPPFLN